MQKEQEKWVENVMNSLQGMQAAQPPADLFTSITSKLNQPEAKVIPLRRIQLSIAVASILLLLNAFALQMYAQNGRAISSEIVAEDSSLQLMSNFKIYE